MTGMKALVFSKFLIYAMVENLNFSRIIFTKAEINIG